MIIAKKIIKYILLLSAATIPTLLILTTGFTAIFYFLNIAREEITGIQYGVNDYIVLIIVLTVLSLLVGPACYYIHKHKTLLWTTVIISALTNLMLIILIAFLITPVGYLFWFRIFYNVGVCNPKLAPKTIAYLVKNQTDPEIKTLATEKLQNFCTALNEVMNPDALKKEKLKELNEK